MGEKSRTVLVALAVVLGGACADEEKRGAELPCATVDRACTPAFEPTFDNLMARTFRPSCALSGASCHAPEGAQAGLVLADADAAYAALRRDGRAVAGDPECSVLSKRIHSVDVATQMPPGRPLSAGETCAIVQWLARGATR